MKRGASVLEGALTFVVIGSPSAWEMKEDEDSTHSAKNCVVRFIQSLHWEWPQASFVIGKANESLADAIDGKIRVDICELDKELQGIADDIHASILVAGGRQAAEEAALVQEKPMFHVAVEKLAPYEKSQTTMSWLKKTPSSLWAASRRRAGTGHGTSRQRSRKLKGRC